MRSACSICELWWPKMSNTPPIYRARDLAWEFERSVDRQSPSPMSRRNRSFLFLGAPDTADWYDVTFLRFDRRLRLVSKLPTCCGHVSRPTYHSSQSRWANDANCLGLDVTAGQHIRARSVWVLRGPLAPKSKVDRPDPVQR